MAMGITVVPFVKDGKPFARVELVGTVPESVEVIDAEGAEIAVEWVGAPLRGYHVLDYRGADAVSG